MTWRLRFWRKPITPEPAPDIGSALPILSKPITPDMGIPITAATLVRDDVRASCIRGTLVAKGQTFYVLERPWLDNARNQSCIPAGTYRCAIKVPPNAGKYRNVYEVHGVPGRSAILIHNGNTVNHSRGCLIIGMVRMPMAGQPAVGASRTALAKFRELMQGQDFTLTIIGDQKWQA